ncbi:TNT domain-containing protein [Schaalia odontolytica]|uniref:TNT domain-containing protein n=1 Tax=Schaalia odontolytica TaxID=1660 RepID=UPI00211C0962|nr:TNT domain-containing protein [Schaalia odontolytica]UUO93639.1 TNT domain-containing protein [Schaalia odontolytica]
MGVLHTGAPDFEIMGDAVAIRGRVAVMRDRASDCERIAWSLQEISAPGWVGRAADRFHEHFKMQPDKWWCASATFGRAADAWEAYATALEEAQARAAAAKASYEAGVASVEAALAEQRWASEHPQHDALGFPVWDFSYHPERDTRPGEAAKEQAIADFNAAVGDTDAAGEALAQTLYELSERSPDPSWAPVHFARRAVAGIFDGVWGLLTMTYGVAAEALWDYGRYMLGWMSWEELVAKRTVLPGRDMLALRDAILADPKGFARKMVEGLLNVDGWADDPGAALGELVPGAVLAALSVAPGAGARAARLTAVIESLPIVGEGMMLRDMGVNLGTLALKGATHMDLGAGGMTGRLSSHLDDYLRTHGMEDLADHWKAKRAFHLRSLPDNAEDLASRVPLTNHQTGGQAPPTEGLVDGYKGADLAKQRELILGQRPDGTSYTYKEWQDQHGHWGTDPHTWLQKWKVDWPPNDGYAGDPTIYSSVEDYVRDFGGDVDRIGHPAGNYLGAIEGGTPASFEERSLQPSSVNDYYYQYEFTGEQLPEGWTIKSGKVAGWGQQPGGATQLQVLGENGKPVSVQDLLDKGVLRGKKQPVGLPPI